MNRLLIVPAAGRGSRLGALVPKALVKVNGVAMIDHVLRLHRSTVDRAVVVVSPHAFPLFEDHLRAEKGWVDLAVQPEPLGMIDATLAPFVYVQRYAPLRVVVTWCDQIAVQPATLARLRASGLRDEAPNLIVPTVRCPQPYTHIVQRIGEIVGVRHASEGDTMPAVGLSDIGVFDLSEFAYIHYLTSFAGSGRRGLFLPFLPWLAKREYVALTEATDPMEARGINTPEDLRAVETYLQGVGVE